MAAADDLFPSFQLDLKFQSKPRLKPTPHMRGHPRLQTDLLQPHEVLDLPQAYPNAKQCATIRVLRYMPPAKEMLMGQLGAQYEQPV